MSQRLLSPKRVIAAVVTLVVVAGLVASSLYLDHRADRRRPMFKSLIRMEQLQYDLVKAGKPGMPLVARRNKGPVTVNGVPYRPSGGVTVIVRLRDGKTCVHAKNRWGDHTDWQCVDDLPGRPILGGLD